ncbi:MAG: hypothetical protein BEN19_02745 [Epulopiscium sp. Nuni2H_MBin003]|nr:MAG: hypothetical protein BEN19_02745 [Epulopiscium sp. Nuni2H_MBin003]
MEMDILIRRYYKVVITISAIFFVIIIFLYLYNFSDIMLINKPKDLVAKERIAMTAATETAHSYSMKYFDDFLAIPYTDNNHIVYILSDNMDLSYLATNIASYGYLTILVDISEIEDFTDFFKTHVKTLSTAFSSTDTIYQDFLLDKGDISKVSIIGIGDSGRCAYELSLSPLDSSLVNVVSTLVVAPNLQNISSKVPSTPVGIVLSQYDGVVKSLNGQSIFDNHMLKNSDIIHPISCIYLMGSNHSYFDASYAADDAFNIDSVVDPPNGVEIERLSDESQQDFLSKYAVDFLNYYHHGQIETNIGLDIEDISPSSLYGYDVLSSLIIPDSLAIVTPTDYFSTKYNNLGGEIYMSNASISYMVENYMAPYDTAIGFLHPGIFNDISLLNISWRVDSGLFVTEIPKSYADFTEYKALSMWISANPYNVAQNETQPFIVTLKDSSGKVEHILLDEDILALKVPTGVLVTNSYQIQWSTFTPLSNIRIPLDLFTKVNLENIESISFNFNQTDQGSIILGDIRLL